MKNNQIKSLVRAKAAKHGFDLCRFSTLSIDKKHPHALQRWLDEGMHGDMGYMAEAVRLQRRKHPESMLDDAKTVLTLAMRHSPPSYDLQTSISEHSRGVIASYAHGDDYHEVMKKKLKAFARDLDELLGKYNQRVYVDTAPVLEHALAELSGLGWQGKHTLTIDRELGSWMMLGEVFTTAEIAPDEPASHHCGSCTDCLDVCPTQAIVAPFKVDARLCVSYLTIEYKGFIPHKLRPLIGNRIFGCDDCQMVCPWNQKLPVLELDQLSSRKENILPELAALFALDDQGFRKQFRKSPVKRAGRAGLLRNVAIAMGNSGKVEFVPILLQSLEDDEPLIRGHAAWALAELYPHTSNGEILQRLTYHSAQEDDHNVLEEMTISIEKIKGSTQT